jgi:pentatricopeptide repeat protein
MTADDRRWMQAHGLLDEMRSAGVTPDVYSYSSAISACEKGG